MKLDPIARAAAAAVLLVVPVSIQALAPDAVDSTAGHLVFAVSQLLGWLLVASVVREVPVPGRRAAGFGRGCVLAGVACQVVFALLYGATAVDGEPLEAAFALFLLGFLALTVGGFAWGFALLRTPEGRRAGAGLLAVGGLGLLAMLVGVDPFHDVFLLTSYAAWVVVGLSLRSSNTHGADAVVAR
jgi:hypothetical protein